jgi:hypothetical protein
VLRSLARASVLIVCLVLMTTTGTGCVRVVTEKPSQRPTLEQTQAFLGRVRAFVQRNQGSECVVTGAEVVYGRDYSGSDDDSDIWRSQYAVHARFVASGVRVVSVLPRDAGEKEMEIDDFLGGTDPETSAALLAYSRLSSDTVMGLYEERKRASVLWTLLRFDASAGAGGFSGGFHEMVIDAKGSARLVPQH